jgi:hypothetical protein
MSNFFFTQHFRDDQINIIVKILKMENNNDNYLFINNLLMQINSTMYNYFLPKKPVFIETNFFLKRLGLKCVMEAVDKIREINREKEEELQMMRQREFEALQNEMNDHDISKRENFDKPKSNNGIPPIPEQSIPNQYMQRGEVVMKPGYEKIGELNNKMDEYKQQTNILNPKQKPQQLPEPIATSIRKDKYKPTDNNDFSNKSMKPMPKDQMDRPILSKPMNPTNNNQISNSNISNTDGMANDGGSEIGADFNSAFGTLISDEDKKKFETKTNNINPNKPLSYNPNID